jgi:hypothetical protein
MTRPAGADDRSTNVMHRKAPTQPDLLAQVVDIRDPDRCSSRLAGPTKSCSSDAYVMIDIYSRYMAGARVTPTRPACSGVDT